MFGHGTLLPPNRSTLAVGPSQMSKPLSNTSTSIPIRSVLFFLINSLILMRSIVVVCFFVTDSSGFPALPPPTVFFVAAIDPRPQKNMQLGTQFKRPLTPVCCQLNWMAVPFHIDTLPTCEGMPQVTGTVNESL